MKRLNFEKRFGKSGKEVRKKKSKFAEQSTGTIFRKIKSLKRLDWDLEACTSFRHSQKFKESLAGHFSFPIVPLVTRKNNERPFE